MICAGCLVERLQRAPLPLCLAAFPSTCIVRDCTEIFSQQSSSLPARKQMFSSYKHRVTYKFLVGISPSGYVAYVSEACGGRASDKLISYYSIFNEAIAGASAQ